MDITVNIPDEQWKEFQEMAQETVDKSWEGKHEDFAVYIMLVNIERYIESQKRKQSRKEKRNYAASLHTERMKELGIYSEKQ